MNKETGKRGDIHRYLPAGSTEADFAETKRSLLEASNPTGPDAAKVNFDVWATQTMDTRIALGKIVSPETKAKWERALDADGPIGAAWGDRLVAGIMRNQVQDWIVELAKEYKPSSVETYWGIFRAIMSRAAVHFDIKDPTTLIELPDGSSHRTYTVEEPNSLLPSELPAFFNAAWEHEREHFAMLSLGMLTGRRACELRPLRREGRYADLNWKEGTLLVRRSQTIGEAMEVTKTKKDVVLFLPDSVLDILRTHIAGLTPSRRESELLFPPRRSETLCKGAGYMSKSALDKPIRNICEKAGIKKHLTAKGAMRRTYQDLCRAAQVNETVQMAMSGHATKEMVELYSSASADEKRLALYRMFDIAGLKEAARLSA